MKQCGAGRFVSRRAAAATLAKGIPSKKTAALVAAATGLPRRELYAQALLLRQSKSGER
jgi:16S rRNA C1402 (ribose-2'-O) methylase RsmI